MSADRRGKQAEPILASVGTRDCYLADEGGAEVYLAHHHDKVVVSMPTAGTGAELVQELADASWLFTDVPGYPSAMDEDEDSAHGKE